MLITACSTNGTLTNSKNSDYGTNVSNRLYSYCINESCVPVTQLVELSPEDLKPLEPEIGLPPQALQTKAKVIKKHIKKHKAHKKIKKRRKTNSSPNLVKKCFYVNRNESGTLTIEGDKLVSTVSKSLINIPESSSITNKKESK
jgi:hypothetical protein